MHDLGTWELIEGVRSGSVVFRENFAGRSNLPGGGHMTRGSLTTLCRRFNRPIQLELISLYMI
jgi:hypothetical protein